MYEWHPYDGLSVVHFELMKRVSNGRPKSSHLHNEIDIERARLLLHVACANKVATIASLVQRGMEFIRSYDIYVIFIDIMM